MKLRTIIIYVKIMYKCYCHRFILLKMVSHFEEVWNKPGSTVLIPKDQRRRALVHAAYSLYTMYF